MSDSATKPQPVGDTLQLPSRGFWYKSESGEPLLPDGRVQLRKLGLEEEEMLNTPGIDMMEKIKQMIARCVVLPNGMKHEDLLVTDRFAALLMLRTVTFGPEYSFPMRCSRCGETTKVKVNILRDLNETTPDVVRDNLRQWAEDRNQEVPPLEEPWTIHLPDTNSTLTLRHLRGRDEDQIFTRSRRARMQSGTANDPSHKLRLALSIETIDGIRMSTPDKETWLRKNVKSMADSVRIQNSIDLRETAIDPTLILKCRACGADNERRMEFGEELFRPSDL